MVSSAFKTQETPCAVCSLLRADARGFSLCHPSLTLSRSRSITLFKFQEWSRSELLCQRRRWAKMEWTGFHGDELQRREMPLHLPQCFAPSRYLRKLVWPSTLQTRKYKYINMLKCEVDFVFLSFSDFYLSMLACQVNALGGHKRASDPQQLGLQEVVTCLTAVLGAGLRSSAGTARAFNCRANLSAPMWILERESSFWFTTRKISIWRILANDSLNSFIHVTLINAKWTTISLIILQISDESLTWFYVHISVENAGKRNGYLYIQR